MNAQLSRWEWACAGIVVVAGLLLRGKIGLSTYLNPDEAVQALVAFGSWGDMLKGSLQFTHPPLIILITHVMSWVSRTELALRLVPILAGSLFPILLSLWLRRVVGEMAALAALFLLTLAPHLVNVSAQLRSYTLAFLFLSASLLLFEQAIENDRMWTMAAYNVALWLCILSDYSVAWFAGAAGVYALLRLRGSSNGVKAMWAGGQLVALLLYCLMFAVHVQSFRGGAVARGAITGWLRGGFPGSAELLVFPFKGTVKQFAYLTASVPLGVLALILFCGGLFLLWTGRTGIERRKARALVVLFVLPFVLGLLGAYANQFPYGRSRHTLVLGIFGACGVAVLLEALPRRAGIALLWAALLVTPLWHWQAVQDWNEMDADRLRKELIVQTMDYMRSAIPPGTLIFTERETLWILAYYFGHNQLPPRAAAGRFSETLLGAWRIGTRDYKYLTQDEYKEALLAFRRHYGLSDAEPVWVLDGGWDVVSVRQDELRPFTRAVRVFQTGMQ